MVRHIVSWNFKPEVTPERREELHKELAEKFTALVGKIPGLTKVEVGMPPLGSSNCWLSTARWKRRVISPYTGIIRSIRPSQRSSARTARDAAV